MKCISTTSARNGFTQLLVMAQSEPIRITRRSRDVAIVMSPDEFRRMAETARGKVNPAVERLHAESAKRWASVHAALAR
jgi:prevent-host-death family protein